MALKTVGVIRKMDKAGYLIIPVGIRYSMGIDANDPMECYIESDQIILKKYEPDCLFCGDDSNIQVYRGKKVCRKCVEAIFENIKTG